MGKIELNENQNKSTAQSKEFFWNGMFVFSAHEKLIKKTNKNTILSKKSTEKEHIFYDHKKLIRMNNLLSMLFES